LKAFSEQLIFLGNGKWSENSDRTIEFPTNFFNIMNSIEPLIKNVFPDIQKYYTNHEWSCEKAILGPTNT
jgi:hypothetical protein